MSGAPERALWVVVVAYGSVTSLEAALDGLGGAPVIVIDNASDPATTALAARRHARYVDPGANLGFAAGVNRALSLVPLPATDVLLLNPDARISAGDVAELHRALRSEPRLAAVAPAWHRDDAGGDTPGSWPWHTPLGAWAEAFALRRPKRDGGFLSGAVLLLRGEALTAVGVLDERFFLYAEDEDWQRRALMKGWGLRACDEVVARHDRGGSEGDLRRQQLRLHAAIERYVRKWYGPFGWLVYRTGVAVGAVLRAAVHRGWRRSAALWLLRTYLVGPDRVAQRAGALPRS